MLMDACAVCGNRAVHRHHIVKQQRIRKLWASLIAARRRGGSKPWSVTKALADPRGWIPVCSVCHVEESPVPLPEGFWQFVDDYELGGLLPRWLDNLERRPAAVVRGSDSSNQTRLGTGPAVPQEVSVSIATVPPSINTNAVRSHWRGFHTAKKRWQADLESLLLAAFLPRPLNAVGPIAVEVQITFPDRRRRDSENFRPVLSKALGDALVNGGWLADDTDQDWRLQVVIDPDRGPHETRITLRWEKA